MAGKRGNGSDSIYKSAGRWYVQGYLDEGEGPVRRKVSAATRKAAVDKWAERKQDAAAGVKARADFKNMEELLHHWFEVRSLELRYATRTGYRHSIDAHLIPFFRASKLKEVTPAKIEHWQYTLSVERGLAYSSIHQARVILKQAFDMAVRHRSLSSNPVAFARAPMKRATRIDPMTEAQAQHLIKSINPEDVHARARVLLALTLGLRQGELLALQWRDVDLASTEPVLHVRASLQRQTGKGLVRVEPKTEKSRRSIRLSAPHVEVLRTLSLQQKERRLSAGGQYNPDGYVFASSAGTAVDPANDRKLWLRLLSEAGLPPFRVHSSRHTAATLLLKEEGLPQVQQVLGHSTIRTTVDIYGHLTAADCAAGIDKVTQRLTG